MSEIREAVETIMRRMRRAEERNVPDEWKRSKELREREEAWQRISEESNGDCQESRGRMYLKSAHG
eukprot:gene11805-2192_t